MKKILIPIIALLFSLAAVAQTNPNRTAKTKVSDALAMMPAQDEAMYNQMMKDLVSTGSEGVTMLTGMFNDVNNVPVNYALSGWSAYVTQFGSDVDRKTFSRGIVDALKNSRSNVVGTFYMSLLGQVGGNESVPALASFLGGDLTNPALAALVSIGGDDVKKVISDAVANGKGPKVAFAKAVGDANVTGLESTLISWLAGADAKTKEAIYYALARTGTSVSLPILKKAATDAGYADEPTKAVEAYVDLLSRFAKEGHAAQLTLKEANALTTKALAKKEYNAALAGFNVCYDVEGGSAFPRVLKAMDNSSRVYRVGVLKIVRDEVTEAQCQDLLNKAAKVKTNQTKADIVTFVGNSGYNKLASGVTPYIGSPDDELNMAAMRAATLLGGKDVPQLLVNQLVAENSSEAVVASAKESLLFYNGNVNNVVAEGAKNGSTKGRVAALSILANKKATDKSQLVMDLADSDNKEIVIAAYDALPFVVSEKDVDKLYNRLNTVSADNSVAKTQEAIIATFGSATPAKKSADVKGRMDKAGDKAYRYLVPLAATGDVAMLDVITEKYNKGNAQEKKAALEALLNWKGMEAAEYIFDIAANDNSAEALDGYISLVARSSATPENKVIMLTDAMGIAKNSAQKIRILAVAGRLPIFQSFIFASQSLDDRDASVKSAAAEAVMNVGLANKSIYGPVAVETLKKASGLLTGRDKGYQQEAISKHISELPSDGGYVSIFNGRDLTGWKGLVDNPIARRKMTPAQLAERQKKADEIMRKEWVVKDGLLEFEGKGYYNICTDKDYGDFEMYVDWKLYPDSDEADGGIYLRGTPQVQMWDIARTNVGAQVGSGGLYNNSVNERNPLVVADNKLGEWNTFYIKMVGERVTVYLNGILVVDNIILENYWDRKQPIFPVDQIELQAHGTRVAYRNIYINELPRVEPYTLSAEEQKEGFEVLFDGLSMHKWRGNTTDYVSEDGQIVLYPGKGSGGNLYTKDQFDDFVFRFEFMLTPGANNGLGIRTPLEGDAAYVGMELQILDDDAPIYSTLEKYQYHGSVYGVIPAKRGALKPLGEWNYQEVYAKGDHIRIVLNGETIVDGNIREAAKNGTIDGKEHPGLFNKSGHIAFLGHGSVVKFKNIRVKKLK